MIMIQNQPESMTYGSGDDDDDCSDDDGSDDDDDDMYMICMTFKSKHYDDNNDNDDDPKPTRKYDLWNDLDSSDRMSSSMTTRLIGRSSKVT